MSDSRELRGRVAAAMIAAEAGPGEDEYHAKADAAIRVVVEAACGVVDAMIPRERFTLGEPDESRDEYERGMFLSEVSDRIRALALHRTTRGG